MWILSLHEWPETQQMKTELELLIYYTVNNLERKQLKT